MVCGSAVGVLSGEKQRDRGYDYNGVVTWFAQHSDRILLLFDAYKLDLSDEFKDATRLLQPTPSLREALTSCLVARRT